ncbi:MAG: hypothetical protein H0X25_03415 [Acidobacteriales bacterium]|nr:hypothetical protein [Terriglobales bacterium]
MSRYHVSVFGAIRDCFADLLAFLSLLLRCRRALAVENLFLRKQLAFYRERQGRPRPLTDSCPAQQCRHDSDGLELGHP